jgi:hypothetical protein
MEARKRRFILSHQQSERLVLKWKEKDPELEISSFEWDGLHFAQSQK